MKYTHCDPTVQACRRRVAVHEWRRRRDGFAPWTVRNRETGAVIGWGGLYDDPFDPGWGIELAYYFDRGSWGKGFASELCRAALDFADNKVRAPKVSAFAHPKNLASNAILGKLGFKHHRFVSEMNRNLYVRLRNTDQSPIERL